VKRVWRTETSLRNRCPSSQKKQGTMRLMVSSLFNN